MRQILTYGANVLGGVVLARLLPPAEFGFYAVVSLFLAFLNIFGGTGFAGNLIRMPEEPTLHAYRTVFTAQQLIVGVVSAAVWFASPWISKMYGLHEHGIWFFRLSALSLVFTSLMVIPQITMERNLAFDKLALIEVAQAVSFNFVAILLAWRHFGIVSFACALVVRSAVGAVLANAISPWKTALLWDPEGLRSHIAFGVTLQGGQILSMIKDSITPLFVGLFLGAQPMGYATWAMTFANYPAVLLMPMQRLYMPFFARLQNDLDALARFVPRTLWIVNAIAAPLAVLSVALATPITTIIFGQQWLVALPLFYCFSAASVSAAVNTPLMGLLNALGKPHLNLIVIGLAMLAIWALGVPLIVHFGLFGFGLATIGASFANILLYWFIWRGIGIQSWRSFWPAWPLALCIGILLLVLQRMAPVHTILVLLMDSVSALGIYGIVLWCGWRQPFDAWIRLVRHVE
jgi:O-antigen/teichoic acid export membrane protein